MFVDSSPQHHWLNKCILTFSHMVWNVKKNCHRLYSGYSNQTDKKGFDIYMAEFV